MNPVRVLIVDDSAVIRKVLSNLLASDPEITVAGTAGNGHQALERIPETRPDWSRSTSRCPAWMGWKRWSRFANSIQPYR
jgi:CheY-like chemotaxis protein